MQSEIEQKIADCQIQIADHKLAGRWGEAATLTIIVNALAWALKRSSALTTALR